jgi:Fe-S cluster assembly iron-binding protein IscA
MGLALDEPEKDEKPVRINGIDVLIEDLVRPFVDFATVDYVKDQYQEGFLIKTDGDCCSDCSDTSS